jgi:maltose alpha-D-glucosyltransferase/alpha-amylase
MPRIFMALKKGTASDMVEILNRTPPIPDNCQWCIFLRNHDELTLEMVTPEERDWMWETYAPDSRMKLNLGIRRRLAPLLDNDPRKIALANSLLFTLPGSPILYYGDEIGMGDNIWMNDRNGVRTAMLWEAGTTAGFSDAKPESLYAPIISDEVYGPQRVNVQSQRESADSLWNVIRHMVSVRKNHREFGRGDFKWMELQNEHIVAYQRTYEGRATLGVHNLSNTRQTVSFEIEKSVNSLTDLLTEKSFAANSGRLELELEPYQYLWLT